MLMGRDYNRTYEIIIRINEIRISTREFNRIKELQDKRAKVECSEARFPLIQKKKMMKKKKRHAQISAFSYFLKVNIITTVKSVKIKLQDTILSIFSFDKFLS